MRGLPELTGGRGAGHHGRDARHTVNQVLRSLEAVAPSAALSALGRDHFHIGGVQQVHELLGVGGGVVGVAVV
jgi:hypothetical protein